MARIVLEGVTKRFGRTTAVDAVDLEVEDGELVVLLGPSGCGKTTLLRCVAGLEYPDGGRVRIGDRDVTDLPPRQRDIAMVFQSYAVFPHLKVFDNIAFGLKMRKVDRSKIRESVERAASLVELSDYLDRYPAQLSGGQRQRVAVARAIVMEPAVLLMDEPLSNLDALLRLTFRAELKKLVSELGTTAIYVTHDQVEALSLGDRIAVMNQGRIVQHDTPTRVYAEPASRFVGGFIGNPPMNFLAGRLGGNGRPELRIGEHAIELPAGIAPAGSGETLVGIRAENIAPATEPSPGAVPARTQVVEPLGSHLLLTAAIGEQLLKVVAPVDFPAQPNRDLWLRLEPAKLRLFELDGDRLPAS
ncbi:MAG TPA: ABC transporter ATP-binding protein [Actinomycetes bacterium]